MNRITKILNIIYCLTVVFFLADSFTSFDIKSQILKSIIYFGVLVGTPLTLIWNLLLIKPKTNRVLGTIFPTIILAIILIVGPMKILFSIGAWHTQTILYQNGHLSSKTIEYQMQDVGARGYNKRTVEVFYLTPLFMITNEVPKDINKSVEWIKVDKNVNELELKFL